MSGCECQIRARRRMLGVMLAGVLALGVPAAAIADLPATVVRIKPSIVAVGTFQRTRNPSFAFHGTGFAVGNGRLIATNAHVLPEKIATDKFETLAIATISGNSGSIEVRPAKQVELDKGRDLAVLAIEGNSIPVLSLAERGQVNEGQEVAFTGFPIGNALGFFPVTHRGIISAITPIGIPQSRARELDPALIRRLANDPFRVYQLDATAYPGNSGSPLYDPVTGQVIGIVNMVFVKSTKERVLSDPSGISYAIPVEYLAAMIAGLP